MGTTEQIECRFVPEIDAGLKTDLHLSLGYAFEQPQRVLADTKNLVDEVYVIHSPGHQAIDLFQHHFHRAFAKLIAEQGLVAEGARPGTSACEFELGAATVSAEHVVPVAMELDRIVVKIERTECPHLRHAQFGTDMLARRIPPATSGDLLPWLGGKLRQGLVRLPSHGDVTACLAQSSGRSCRGMRANGDAVTADRQGSKPLLRNSEFRRRTSPEQIGGSCRNHQKVWIEVANSGRDIGGLEILNLGINQQAFSARPLYLVSCKKEL